jgi:hypothetical protein
MAKKWLQKLDALAKKGSNAGGRLGIISKAVDAIIPDATTESAKNVKADGDTNTGAGSTTKNADAGTSTPSVVPPVATEPTMSQKWGRMPLWAKGSIIAGGAGLIVLLIKSMTKKKGYSRR